MRQMLIPDLLQMVDGLHGATVRRDGDRLTLVFNWFDDPNVFELSATVPAADGVEHVAGTWDDELVDDLWEDLETGLLVRLVKTRHGNVLRAAPDGPQRYLDDRRFYISAALEYVSHLDEAGLDTAPGLVVRHDGRPLDWWVAYVNSHEGGPALAQLVVSRRSRHEVAIEHVQLLPGTSDLVGWSLVDVAIHHAARHGIHRFCSPSRLEHVHPFAFTRAGSDEMVYDITVNDLNWPATLPTSGTPNG